jgi:hypothetical protein
VLNALGQAAVGAELKKYGLRYDDLLDPIQHLVRALVACSTVCAANGCAAGCG